MGYENIIVDKSIKNEIIYEYNKKRYISKEPLQYIDIISFCDYHWISETGDIFIGENGKIYRTCICRTYNNLFNMVYQDTIELKNIFENTYHKKFKYIIGGFLNGKMFNNRLWRSCFCSNS